ncbi:MULTISPECIES: winged helix-turn-helix domain-containing protein [unclassified Modestobacter]|uniref:winged helix-turn-helix domain-containing protein n=1 Tax=unclassified Modestobacter TaxID=2643866 RepID=UPI0022AA538B|nr:MULTISPECIES: crosslink repair DNA glycosylase YcaQ family protein [unclassified Modestobacter]MCZ2826848.1 winged helix DNA-binding domain-containing protein [Modestobacter sp. VKM Ac-2981]MCZ2855228.1 winged helix DNA-binding domain-containing protein [Modestobacter sp. VKM Ac-2982]
MTTSVERLPAGLARRIALAAQGFAEPRPTGIVGTRQLRRTADRLAVVQIDSVNVLSRSHYLPFFSRLGPYRRSDLDALSNRRHDLVEYWAHEASFLPARLHPHLRWRMDAADQEAWGSMTRVQQERPEYVAALLARVRTEGPIRASQLQEERPNRPGSMWNWHAGKAALEYLFFTGALTARGRTAGFERVYDLPERVLPPAVVQAPTPERPEGIRELVRTAARALGVATETDLRDYFRLAPVDARTAIAELADGGELQPVEVVGWNRPAWVDPQARRPRWIRARALLSPFDSLVWERPRVERIFGFRYRLEIYTPAAKRVHGYYVLPFLFGDRLVARVDLKADRQAGVLRVQGTFAEPGVDAPEVAAALAAELRLMADWMALDEVVVAGRGDLAPDLAAAVVATGG